MTLVDGDSAMGRVLDRAVDAGGVSPDLRMRNFGIGTNSDAIRRPRPTMTATRFCS